jgi:hypothetical protein
MRVVPVSLGMFEGKWLVDLEESEESLMDATLTCVLLLDGDEQHNSTKQTKMISSEEEEEKEGEGDRMLFMSQNSIHGPSLTARQLREGLSICQRTAGLLISSV